MAEYRIKETNGQNDAGAWVKPVFNWPVLKAAGFVRLYVIPSKAVHDPTWRIDDNENLNAIRADAEANGISTGLYINPDGIGVSYAKCLMDLASKVGVEDDKHLPSDASDALLPCVMIGSFPSGYKINQVEGDLFNYIHSVLLSKYNNIVLCLNFNTATMLAKSGSKLILDTIALPSVRIWYYRPGFTAEQMDTEFADMFPIMPKKHVWLAGVHIGETLADWQVNPPPIVCPAGQHLDPILNICVDDPLPPDDTTKDERIAAIIRELIPILEKLAKEVETPVPE